jgi:hypothetical protein
MAGIRVQTVAAVAIPALTFERDPDRAQIAASDATRPPLARPCTRAGSQYMWSRLRTELASIDAPTVRAASIAAHSRVSDPTGRVVRCCWKLMVDAQRIATGDAQPRRALWGRRTRFPDTVSHEP